MSAEGTIQGDPLAMGLYALNTQPLITSLLAASSVKQCWFADDARTWWDALSTLGPDFGYFPNDRKCRIIAKPAKGGLGLGNPFLEARREYASSVKVTKPLVEQIVSQSHQLPEDSLTKLAQQEVRSERLKEFEHRTERIKEMAPRKTQRALDLAAEKGSSAWLTVLPLQYLGLNLNKRVFRDAIKLRYDWPVEDIPSTCACGEAFTVDHSMICKLGGFITQRNNELRDLEAEFLSMVCSDVEIELVLQEISGEHFNRGSN